MTFFKILLAVLGLLIAVDLAVAATTLTTPAFPADSAGITHVGTLSCAVTNGSDKTTSSSTVTLLNSGGVGSLESLPPIPPGGSANGSFSDALGLGLASCRCSVPNTLHKCSLMYVDPDSGAVVVVPGN